jgi:hypothetical protein
MGGDDTEGNYPKAVRLRTSDMDSTLDKFGKISGNLPDKSNSGTRGLVHWKACYIHL